jgi:CDP-glucose 4,6-dehydratase
MTTDKVYRNHESTRPYQEEDELGGVEPYGSSKACAEIVAETYRSSYFAKMGIALATVRAGNVIGGGDFSQDRIIPDYVRAIQAGVPINLRHPDATRPWQFVMEPIRACLILAEHMQTEPEIYSGGWNIGPDAGDNVSVQELIIRFGKIWGTSIPGIERDKGSFSPYEAKMLAINSSKIRAKTGWKPAKPFARGLEATADWYKAYLNAKDPAALSFKQAKEWIDA